MPQRGYNADIARTGASRGAPGHPGKTGRKQDGYKKIGRWRQFLLDKVLFTHYHSVMNTLCWQVTGGSVRGREHGSTGRNNQDAFFWRMAPEALAAVVCDGCGSAPESEAGARLGARLAVESLLRARPEGRDPVAVLEEARQRILQQLERMARAMSADPREAIHDCFLFTIVGALIAGERATLFAIGDGIAAVNGETVRIGPFPDNRPPYIAYGIFPPEGFEDAGAFRFRILASLPAREVRSLLIGTDGAAEWDRLEDQTLPGKGERVGPLSQFWSDDCYFSNRDALRRRLAILNREAISLDRNAGRIVRRPGLLGDDTTLVAIRRS